MGAVGYTVSAGAAVALTATTAKSVIGVKAHANSGLNLIKVRFGFDGVTASDKGVLVEVCYCTFGANSPGTNSTSVTPAQGYGRVLTAGFTAGRTWTTEPTTITVLEEITVTPYGGSAMYDFPLGTAYDCALAEGFVVRFTAPTSAVNVRASLVVERC